MEHGQTELGPILLVPRLGGRGRRAVLRRAAPAAADAPDARQIAALQRGRGRRGSGLLPSLANVASMLHDVHIDLTREKIFTPSSQAMAVVDQLQQPVRLTYFYRGQDPSGRRMKDVLEVMGRRNPLLEVRTVDPDREPSLAKLTACGMANAGDPRSRRPQARGPDHRRKRDCDRHPAGAAREGDHRLLSRRAQRISDGQLRVPHPRRRHRRPQPRRRLLEAHPDGGSRHRPAAACAGGAGLRDAQGHSRDFAQRARELPGPDHRESAHHVPAGGKRGAGGLSAARRLAVRDVRSRLRARTAARRADREARRAAAAGGGRRSAQPLLHRRGDGRGHRLRAESDHAERLDDLLSRGCGR